MDNPIEVSFSLPSRWQKPNELIETPRFPNHKACDTSNSLVLTFSIPAGFKNMDSTPPTLAMLAPPCPELLGHGFITNCVAPACPERSGSPANIVELRNKPIATSKAVFCIFLIFIFVSLCVLKMYQVQEAS